MDAAKRAREGQTPGRTPGKNDFKRPAFALGRISFGVDDDSSTASSGEENEISAWDAKPKAFGTTVPSAQAAPGKGGSGGGRGGLSKMGHSSSSGGGGGGGGGATSVHAASTLIRRRALADRSFRENEQPDLDEDLGHLQQQHRFACSQPADGGDPAGSGGGASDDDSRSGGDMYGDASGLMTLDFSPSPSPRGRASNDHRSSSAFDLSYSPPAASSPQRLSAARQPRDDSARSLVARASRGRQATRGAVIRCDSSDDDEFVDCLEMPEQGSLGGESGGSAFGRGVGAGSKSTSRYSGGGGSSSDDDFSMVASTTRKTGKRARDSSSGSAGARAAGSGSDSSAAAGASAGSGRYGEPATTVGDWQQEAGGTAWKMEVGGDSDLDSDNDDSDSDREPTACRGRKALSLPSELYERMYRHQKIGVRWLWGLHQGDMGGILGDDMGLGKTFQVTCFLAGLFRTKQAKSALVLAPKSVMRGWEDELGRWLVKAACPKAEVIVISSEMPAKARRRAIAFAADGGYRGKGAVLITTYGMVSSNPKQFAPASSEGADGWIERGEPQKHMWDYVVLDEGHKIKNASTKTCKAVHYLPTKRRLLLTGTPVQNNLKELHTVVNWATFGKLLGPYKHFEKTFSKPIEYGQDRDASEKAVLRSRARAAELRTMLEPLLLQRSKTEIMDDKATTKTEMVVWVSLSPLQREVYAKYLGGESVKDILSGEVSSPLGAIAHLKKVCLHPLVSSFPLDEPWVLDQDRSVQSLLKDCSKLSVMLEIVKEACSSGHRVLVFSRFVRMLDIIEACIGEERREGGAGLRLCRIDGGHSDLERQHTIARFNKHEKISVCLVSTGAGGTGITLTGADRVILFDPSWNPADDMQAVDRAYRIGQKRDVIVYRMIAAGTVEEKMYEKQIFKDGLRRTIMGGTVKRKKNVRYFSRAELKQLFTLYPAGHCRVRDQLEKMHGPLSGRLEAAEPPAQRNISLDGHLDFVCGLRGAYGASAHGEGLPKIIQQEAAAAAAAVHAEPYPNIGGGGGSGSRVVRNLIDEEEDESDVEDSDGDRGNTSLQSLLHGGAGGRRQAEKSLDELIAMELDLDGGAGLFDDDDGRGGGGKGGGSVPPRRTAVRRATGKGKGPSRRRFLSGIDSDTDDEDVDDDNVLAGGKAGVRGGRTSVAAGAGLLDLSTAGADECTAIALGGDSDDSDVEFDSGGGGGGTRTDWADVANEVVELLDDDNEDDSKDALLSPPPAALDQSIGIESDYAASYPSAMEDEGEEEEEEQAVAAETGRESARCWSDEELGIDPVASPADGTGGGGVDRGGGLTEDEEDKIAAARRSKREAAASAAEKRVAEARKRARAFAEEELGTKNAGRGSWSSCDSSGKDAPDGCSTRSTEEMREEGENEVGERSIGGFRSGDDSTGAGQSGEKVEWGEEREASKVKREEREPRGRSRCSESPAREHCGSFFPESEGGHAGGSPCSPMAVDEDISSWPACALQPAVPAERNAAARGSSSSSISSRRSSSSGWNGSPTTATSSPSRPSLSSPADAIVGDAGHDGSPDTRACAAIERESAGDDEGAGEESCCSAGARGSGEESADDKRRRSELVEDSLSRSTGVGTLDEAGAPPASEVRGGLSCGRGGVVGESGEVLGRRGDISTGGLVKETADVALQQQQQHGQEQGQGQGQVDREFVGQPRRNPEDNEEDAGGGGGGGGGAPVAISAGKGDRGGSGLGPTKATVCPAHATAAERAGFTCRRCSCSAGAEAAELARGLLFEAWAKEREGDTYSAMGVCLEAIKLCDEDMELHKTIARIGSRMGCLS